MATHKIHKLLTHRSRNKQENNVIREEKERKRSQTLFVPSQVYDIRHCFFYDGQPILIQSDALVL